MAGKVRTLLLGLDACDPGLVRRYAADGDMPNLAHLLATGARARFENEPGYFVGSVWPTLMTGVPVDRHHWYTGTLFRPEHYDYVTQTMDTKTLWERCHDVGLRTAVFDAPNVRAVPGPNSVQVAEWGCHGRQHGTHSEPPSLIDELEGRHGTHPIGAAPAFHDPRHSPSDHVHRSGVQRTEAETVALFAALLTGIERKTSASLDLLDRGGWDLFCCVYSEAHCVGHQLWHLHDPHHDLHDSELLARLGVDDPLREVYRRLDRAVGEHLSRVGTDDTAFVLLSHGMRAHHDATHLWPVILHRLDTAYTGLPSEHVGPRARRVDRWLSPLPSRLRVAALRASGSLVQAHLQGVSGLAADDLPPLRERTFIPIDNNTAWGAVRLNQTGREAAGLVPGSERERALGWLETHLRELINVETGGPVVRRVLRSDRVYRHRPGDPLPDLLVEWNIDAPVRTVWSPSIGLVEGPYEGVRSGDHNSGGLLLASGPGMRPGESSASPLDVVPTVASSLGLTTPDLDGSPRLPLTDERLRLRGVGDRGLELLQARMERRRRDKLSADRLDDQAEDVAEQLKGLLAAHHETRNLAERNAEQLAALAEHATAAELLATTAWVRNLEFVDGPLVSVIMPTRNRRRELVGAIESVTRQSYPALEVVVVDDASDDDTWKHLQAIGDDRVRSFRQEVHSGANCARNRGLDEASGELIVYLDDDNTFDRDWVKSVVWAFHEHPDRQVAYGARVVDDLHRHHGGNKGGLPWLQLLPWDRDALRTANRVDINVLAHLRSPIRMDTSFRVLGDWDLLLQLTEQADPVRLPVIASYYTTDAADRLTTSVTHREVEMVREKWALR